MYFKPGIAPAILGLSACVPMDAQAPGGARMVGPAATPSAASCTATESDLFRLFSAQQGMAGANAAVIRVSEAPTTEVISRSPYTYRISDPALCRSLGR